MTRRSRARARSPQPLDLAKLEPKHFSPAFFKSTCWRIYAAQQANALSDSRLVDESSAQLPLWKGLAIQILDVAEVAAGLPEKNRARTAAVGALLSMLLCAPDGPRRKMIAAIEERSDVFHERGQISDETLKLLKPIFQKATARARRSVVTVEQWNRRQEAALPSPPSTGLKK